MIWYGILNLLKTNCIENVATSTNIRLYIVLRITKCQFYSTAQMCDATKMPRRTTAGIPPNNHNNILLINFKVIYFINRLHKECVKKIQIKP